MFKSMAKASLRIYQRFVSPMTPPSCRFLPTCSEYAVETLDKHSFIRAVPKIIGRLFKCHPFHPGGHDPV